MADVADLAQLVEQLIRNEQVVGSNPIISSINIADLAQLVEQLIRNEQVVGSNPIISSIEIQSSAVCGAFLLYLHRYAKTPAGLVIFFLRHRQDCQKLRKNITSPAGFSAYVTLA